MNPTVSLYYIHDPMCSWCWGFKPVLESLTNALPENIVFNSVLGGLAADSDTRMSDEMQFQIKSNWQRIQKTIPNTIFNYDFWELCTPKRSTYPSCRAVLAAELQDSDKGKKMITAIQHAYYLQAKNPSEYDTLYELAEQINLNTEQFKKDIHSEDVQKTLMKQVNFSQGIGVDSLPAIYISIDDTFKPVVLDYNNADIMLDHIDSYI